jgi:hypothetical protein
LAAAGITRVATRQEPEQPAFAGEVVQHTLPSAVLEEDRAFQVHLPESYLRDPGRRYPVIYVLDGSSQDLHTATSAAFLARSGAIPEVIVVGIPNVSGPGRQRDYTPPGMRQDSEVTDGPLGQADRFLAFLRDELVPRIEGDYRTTRPRMLAGNSRGALFVVYSLLAEPLLFDARLGHSPALWRDDEAIVTRLDEFLAASPSLTGFLFLSLGDQENEKMTAAFERAITTLERRAPPTLRWLAEITRGADHGNNAVVATPAGLFATFKEHC